MESRGEFIMKLLISFFLICFVFFIIPILIPIFLGVGILFVLYSVYAEQKEPETDLKEIQNNLEFKDKSDGRRL
jgi:hypothetical protein